MPNYPSNSSPGDRRERHRRRAEREQSFPPDVFTGVPSFLKASLRTARGSRDGYREPGFQHGRHVRRLDPLRVEEDDWLRLIDEVLVPLAEAGDHYRVAGWLDHHYPLVMDLVPKRRRGRYAEGFVEGLFND